MLTSTLNPRVVRASRSGEWARRFALRSCVGLVCALAPASMLASGLARVPRVHERAQGYLGVEFRDTTDEQIGTLHLQGQRGAEITMVDHDGPAGKAGLHAHDIVVQMNGQNIANSEDFRRRIRESSPGTAVSLAIMRQGRAMTVTAQLANREEVDRLAWQQMTVADPPPSADAPVAGFATERYTVNDRYAPEAAPAARPPIRGQSFIGTVLRTTPYTGATVQPMAAQLAGYFGAPPKTGLLVHEVEANSPAAFAGLRAGDVVMRVDAAAVASNSDWAKRLRAGVGRSVSVTILRDKHEKTLTLQPEMKRHSLLELPLPF